MKLSVMRSLHCPEEYKSRIKITVSGINTKRVDRTHNSHGNRGSLINMSLIHKRTKHKEVGRTNGTKTEMIDLNPHTFKWHMHRVRLLPSGRVRELETTTTQTSQQRSANIMQAS